MTPRLKTLREPPLLNAVLERADWAVMKPSDERTIRGELERVRGETTDFSGGERLILLTNMQRLGLRESPSGEDFKYIHLWLESMRRMEHAPDLLFTLSGLRELGVPEEVTDEDMRIIELGFTHANRRRSNISYRMECEMIRLGLKEKPSSKTVKAALDQLTINRGTHNGENLAEIHHQLKRLGRPQKITDSDLKDMRESLDEIRHNMRAGRELARMLSPLQDLPIRGETQTDAAMPPLKRFAGGIR